MVPGGSAPGSREGRDHGLRSAEAHWLPREMAVAPVEKSPPSPVRLGWPSKPGWLGSRKRRCAHLGRRIEREEIKQPVRLVCLLPPRRCAATSRESCWCPESVGSAVEQDAVHPGEEEQRRVHAGAVKSLADEPGRGQGSNGRRRAPANARREDCSSAEWLPSGDWAKASAGDRSC